MHPVQISPPMLSMRGIVMAKRESPLPPVRLKPGDRILTQAEAAKLRGVSRETLRSMAERGEGPRRIQLSRKRFGYLASDFLEI
jgi:predicted DNA-binding transcriptional regulator AlpA